MRKNSIKNTRINSEVQKALAEIIRSEIKDPRVPQFTSVTDVEVAPDLKTCKVWVSFLTQPERYDDAMKGLNKAEGFIRASLAKKINLSVKTKRNTPYFDVFLLYIICACSGRCQMYCPFDVRWTVRLTVNLTVRWMSEHN